MSEYYSVLTRAVEALEKNTGEARRAIYEKSRAALVAQLRGIEPKLSEAEITRQRLALEEAIRKVESEWAFKDEPLLGLRSTLLSDNRSYGALRQTLAQANSLGGAAQEANRQAREAIAEDEDDDEIEEVEDALPVKRDPVFASSASRALPAAPSSPLSTPTPALASSLTEVKVSTRPSNGSILTPLAVDAFPSSQPAATSIAGEAVAPSVVEPMVQAPVVSAIAPATSGLSAGRGESDLVAPIVVAASQVFTAASPVSAGGERKGIIATVAEQVTQRVAPANSEGREAAIANSETVVSLTQEVVAEAETAIPDAASSVSVETETEEDLSPYGGEVVEADAALPVRVDVAEVRPASPVVVQLTQPEDLDARHAEVRETLVFDEKTEGSEGSSELNLNVPPDARPVMAVPLSEEKASNRMWVWVSIGAAAVLFLVGGVSLLTGRLAQLERENSQVIDLSKPVQERMKFTDRLLPEGDGPEPPAQRLAGSSSPTATATLPAAPQAAAPAPQASSDAPAEPAAVATPQGSVAIANTAFLYEEDIDKPGSAKQMRGNVVWQLTQDKNAQGKLDPVIRAIIDVPDRKLRLLMSIRANDGPNAIASHIVELFFIVAKDFEPGGISNVPGLIFKPSESGRGTPIVGASQKVDNGFFFLSVSNFQGEGPRNRELLETRPWFDVPLLYSNGRRAILTIEKGSAGEKVFKEAFALWKK